MEFIIFNFFTNISGVYIWGLAIFQSHPSMYLVLSSTSHTTKRSHFDGFCVTFTNQAYQARAEARGHMFLNMKNLKKYSLEFFKR